MFNNNGNFGNNNGGNNGFNNNGGDNFGGQQQNNGFNNGGQQQQNNGFQQDNNGYQQPQNNGGGMFVDDQATPSSGRGTIPLGKYPVVISESSYEQNSKQTGWVCKTVLTVEGGEYNGRKIFDSYNLQYSAPTERVPGQTQSIGQADYAKLCLAIFGPGYKERDPAKLVGKRFLADVGIDPGKKKNANPDHMYGEQSETQEQFAPRNVVNDRLPLPQANSGGNNPNGQAMSNFGANGQQQNNGGQQPQNNSQPVNNGQQQNNNQQQNNGFNNGGQQQQNNGGNTGFDNSQSGFNQNNGQGQGQQGNFQQQGNGANNNGGGNGFNNGGQGMEQQNQPANNNQNTESLPGGQNGNASNGNGNGVWNGPSFS